VADAFSYRMTALILKRAATSRPSGEWNDDDFDVVALATYRAACERWPKAPITLRHVKHEFGQVQANAEIDRNDPLFKRYGAGDRCELGAPE
jgi:hypothetical protein